MALSNWDTLAFDSDGNPSDGKLTLPSGASIAIYKNWLYVRHPKMWNKELDYAEDTIAEIQSGDLNLAGFNIRAIRHDKQSSVFCYVTCREYTGEGDKKYESHKDYHLAGIGCYGFKSEIEWLMDKHPEIIAKIDPKYLDEDNYVFSTLHKYNGKDKPEEWSLNFSSKNDCFEFPMEIPKSSLDDLWEGVTPETAQAFYDWLKEVAPEYYATIKPEGGLRFNQGDAYFANNLNVELNATAPGESEGPVIGEMLKGL